MSKILQRCHCGKERSVWTEDLKKGNSKQCKSCGAREQYNDMVGKIFHKWKVLEEVESYKSGLRQYKCLCQCGNERVVIGSMLRLGKSKQCDECRILNIGTHHLSNTPTYYSWRAMIKRCTDPKYTQYSSYGGRGISVCDKWKKFINFVEDMGVKPEGHRMALDRIDNDGNYELSNCRWVTSRENNNNRRNSHSNKDKYRLIRIDKLCHECIKIKE